MYINDVLRQVKRLYPSEYDDPEMYIWCNEVSAMLAVEDRNVYHEISLPTDREGSALLPEGVRIENIEFAELNGQRLKKRDLTCSDRRLGCGAPPLGEIRVVYIEPYRPIRLVRYRGEAEIDGDMIRTGACEFLTGDMLDIYSVSPDGTLTLIAENVPLMEVGFDTSDELYYQLIAAPGSIPATAQGRGEKLIVRHVTDRTVCAAPYDSMYIDYILAKINLYQRDIEAYNQHMTAFNSRLGAYKRWLIDHMPPRGGKLENWW